MHLFRTYIGASYHLYALGMLPLTSVVRVVEQTASAYASVEFDSEGQRRRCAAEILSDVAVVVDELPDSQALALVASLHDDLVGDRDDDLREHPRSSATGSSSGGNGEAIISPDVELPPAINVSVNGKDEITPVEDAV